MMFADWRWLGGVLLLMGCAASAQPLPAVSASTSLLIIAPHPDDETLCCAGAAQRVLQAGGRVSIVWLTSGDGSSLSALFSAGGPWLSPRRMRELGMRRMREARAAARILGVPASAQLFLGYPDGLLLRLLRDAPRRSHTSFFTAVAAVPYPEALFPGHAYDGESLRRDFAAVLERVQPTLVLAPTVLDTHPDHRATGMLLGELLAGRDAIARRDWIVHGGEGWPSPRALLPGLPLPLPPAAPQLRWQSFELQPVEEDRKLQALNAYASQLQVTAPFLLAFVRSNELYAPPSGGH